MVVIQVRGGKGNVVSSFTFIEAEVDAKDAGVNVAVDDKDDEGRDVESFSGCKVEVEPCTDSFSSPLITADKLCGDFSS